MDVFTRADREVVEVTDGVYLAQLVSGEAMSAQYFRLEPGASLPEHSHEHEQTGYVTTGVLTLVVNGEERRVGADDAYLIPGDEPHAAENRTDGLVEGVDVFSPPRDPSDHPV
ncbi:cupin domain-containing protein [Halomarina litorea]|uniref:cupin domain-containing protein n=1 Tax=Halomarina litorea TaxID=2961595 RepID=UPI0020C4A01E|nr:cupin domain-containing protein [Halomarina sp. BCD28]